MVVDKINGRIHLVSENKSNSITVGLQIVDAVMIEAVIIVLCSDCLRIYDSISLDFLCILTIPLRLRRRQRITKEAIAEEAAAGNKTFVHGKIVDVDVRRGLIIVRWGCYQIHVWNMGSSINRLRKDTLREGQNKKSSKTTADRVERRFHLQKDLVEHLEVLHDHNEELAQNHKLVQAFGLSDLTEEEMLEYAKFLSVETRSREENAYETNVASDDSNLVEELNKDKYLNLGNVNKRSAFNENEDEDFQLALKMSAFDF